jgi:hypothetical protein
MLALAFLILIGVVLVADGVGQHIEREAIATAEKAKKATSHT